MKSLAILAVLAAFSLGQAQTLFYGGDPDGRNGLVSGSNLASAGQALTYDDFNLASNSNITGFFGDWFVGSADTTSTFTTAAYDIRTGIMDSGAGGTVTNIGTSVASGTVGITAVSTGLTGFGLNIYRMTTGAVGINLAAGHYWLAVAPVGDGTNSIFLTTTSGTAGIGTQAGIGSPLANGNSYFDAISVYGPTGWSRTDNASVLNTGTWDFSYGVTGSPVPEPASMAVLGMGALALIRRRRRV